MTQHTTAENFKSWAEKARGMTVAGLTYSIRDCGEAARAVDSHDPIRAGKYMDEAGTYKQELDRR